MWRVGISNGLAIPYAVCIHVRTSLTSSATSLCERSFPAAWASLVEACSSRLASSPSCRSPMYLNIPIRGEPNNTDRAIPSLIGVTFSVISCLASTSNSNSTAWLANLDSLVNNHAAGLFGVDLSCSRWTELVGLGRSPRSHRSSTSDAQLAFSTHALTMVGAHFAGLHST